VAAIAATKSTIVATAGKNSLAFAAEVAGAAIIAGHLRCDHLLK